jgi:N-acetylglucosaminyl-diphospho-decaprenol L-rhamnosyltransferase
MNTSASSVAGQKPTSDSVTESITVSVIIPSYNARDLLVDCVQSIYQNPPSAPYEIIVVDDASVDDTSEIVRTRFPEVRLLRNEVNQHYARSNIRAIKQARGQYIYLLNNDTIVLPHALDALLLFLQEHPEAGAVGSKLLNGDGTIQWSVKSLPNPGSALFGARSIITRIYPNNRYSRKHLQHLDHDLSKPFVAGYVSSASVMMPRKVVDEVGELDRRLSYHIDADYCKRIADAGYKCYYLPAATVIHFDHKGGTMVSLRRRFRSLVEFHVGSYIFYHKHIQQSRWSPFQVVVVAGLFARFLVSVGLQVLAEFPIGIARTVKALGWRRRTRAGRTIWRGAPSPSPAVKAADSGSDR